MKATFVFSGKPEEKGFDDGIVSAKEDGFDAVVLAGDDVPFRIPSFMKSCLENSVAPVVGFETTVEDDGKESERVVFVPEDEDGLASLVSFAERFPERTVSVDDVAESLSNETSGRILAFVPPDEPVRNEAESKPSSDSKTEDAKRKSVEREVEALERELRETVELSKRSFDKLRELAETMPDEERTAEVERIDEEERKSKEAKGRIPGIRAKIARRKRKLETESAPVEVEETKSVSGRFLKRLSEIFPQRTFVGVDRNLPTKERRRISDAAKRAGATTYDPSDGVSISEEAGTVLERAYGFERRPASVSEAELREILEMEVEARTLSDETRKAVERLVERETETLSKESGIERKSRRIAFLRETFGIDAMRKGTAGIFRWIEDASTISWLTGSAGIVPNEAVGTDDGEETVACDASAFERIRKRALRIGDENRTEDGVVVRARFFVPDEAVARYVPRRKTDDGEVLGIEVGEDVPSGLVLNVVVPKPCAILGNAARLAYESRGIDLFEREWEFDADAMLEAVGSGLPTGAKPFDSPEGMTATVETRPSTFDEAVAIASSASELAGERARISTSLASALARTLKECPEAFFAAFLNASNRDSARKVMKELVARGIEIERPDVQRSAWECRLSATGILAGYDLVLGVSREDAERISTNGRRAYSSIPDFAERSGVSSATAKALARAGALDELHPSRKGILLACDGIFRRVERLRLVERRAEEARRRLESGRISTKKEEERTRKLLERDEEETAGIRRILKETSPPVGRAETDAEREEMEASVLPLPITSYVPEAYASRPSGTTFVKNLVPDEIVSVYGIVSGVVERTTRKSGRRTASFLLSDGTGFVKVECLPSAYAANPKATREGNVLLARGKVEDDDRGNRRIVASFVGKASGRTRETVVVKRKGEPIPSGAELSDEETGSRLLAYDPNDGTITKTNAFVADFEPDGKVFARTRRPLGT